MHLPRSPRRCTPSPRTPRALRSNIPALVLTLVLSIVFPLLVQGMSLFVAAVLPLIVVAASPFVLP